MQFAVCRSRQRVHCVLASSTIFFTYVSVIIVQCSAEKTKCGQELQHMLYNIVKTAYNASYVTHRTKNPADLSRDVLRRKEYRATFHGGELLSRKAAYKTWHIIYALLGWKRARGSEERGNVRVARDTTRLELQGSKDVGTCRDLQSQNYGYTIGNDTAQTIISGWVPHETARYTIEHELRARWRRKSATHGDQLRFSLEESVFF